MDSSRIPVTIITGFLGAGKTTLLNKIIGKHPEKKFAIIENEFGATGIDGGLIKAATDSIFELSNGCICCSLGEDFMFTLENLLGSNYAFDYLLIETTGIADPSGIVDAFVTGSSVQQKFKIDSVVCMADAVNMVDLIDKQPEVRKQLVLADLVLLNKTDCVRREELARLTDMVTSINPTAKVASVSFGEVADIDILDTHAFSAEAISNSTLLFCTPDFSGFDQSDQKSFVHLPAKSKLPHIHDMMSLGFTFRGDFDVNKFGLWLQNYLYFNRDTVFRVKGIMSFAGADDQFILHAVRSSFMFEVGKPWGELDRFSKLVVIGKDLSASDLEANLLQLMVP